MLSGWYSSYALTASSILFMIAPSFIALQSLVSSPDLIWVGFGSGT